MFGSALKPRRARVSDKAGGGLLPTQDPVEGSILCGVGVCEILVGDRVVIAPTAPPETEGDPAEGGVDRPTGRIE